jgi:hypothetical protein
LNEKGGVGSLVDKAIEVFWYQWCPLEITGFLVFGKKEETMG